jgi:6-phosphogluconate dehydrogenase
MIMGNKADIGVIGMAVMGQNLVLNMNDKGFSVAVYNRTTSKVDEFMDGPAQDRDTIYGAHSIEEFIGLLDKPRKVMLMVKAGNVVDSFIEMLTPYLDSGDVIIDGGNSHFPDTMRRTKELEEKKLLFVGTGVSGGEEGARHGPSLMPGGNPEAWSLIKDIFQAIAAKTNQGEPCCNWVGENGAGHYVKMVHNGIEYGDIQIICEAYHLMKAVLGLSPDEMHSIFQKWNNTELDSYLIEITSDILAFKDEDGEPLVEKILDTAGQKGTGKWTAINSLEMGIPVTLIGEAVFSRFLSALKEERVQAAKQLEGPSAQFSGDREQFIEDIRQALLASKVISYAQGFMLMREAAREYQWNLEFGEIALMWREGCIIRSVFLEDIKRAFDKNPALRSLLLDEYFKELIDSCQASWRRVVAGAAEFGVPVPAFSSALSFYDGYRCGRLPANLLQAQRDYFGAHTYERIDTQRGEFFHTNWTGSGGDVSSTSYNA